eukprot:2275728-Pyramimonas_sp.AAC.1
MKEWEQWAGMAQRGEPDTPVLFRTESDRATKKAPGPGAIKKKQLEVLPLEPPQGPQNDSPFG